MVLSIRAITLTLISNLSMFRYLRVYYALPAISPGLWVYPKIPGSSIHRYESNRGVVLVMGNCGLCHQQTWLEIPGRKLEMDKKTPHMCKGIQQQNTIQVVKELPQTTREKRIDELAVTRTAAFERIAADLEKNNNQNVADAIYYLAESIVL